MSTHYQRNGKKDLITSIGGNAGGYIFKKIYNLFNKKNTFIIANVRYYESPYFYFYTDLPAK